MGTPAQKYYPQIDKNIPINQVIHFQNLYSAVNDHDQAIVTLKSQLTAAITAAKSATATNTVTTVTNAVTLFPGIGRVNNQTGATTYTVQSSDNGVLLLVDDASPVAVTLNSMVAPPYLFFLTNLGAGTATLTPTAGTVNGGATFAVLQNYTSLVVFDGTNWWASVLPVAPQTIAAATSKWLNSYTASTGLFTATQPAVGDVTGAAPLASPTFTGKVTTPILANTAVQTPVTASGGGTVTFSQPEQGASYKKVVIYCAAATGTAAYVFPTAFSFAPMVLSQSLTATVTTLSTTGVTVTGAASTGFIALEGY